MWFTPQRTVRRCTLGRDAAWDASSSDLTCRRDEGRRCGLLQRHREGAGGRGRQADGGHRGHGQQHLPGNPEVGTQAHGGDSSPWEAGCIVWCSVFFKLFFHSVVFVDWFKAILVSTLMRIDELFFTVFKLFSGFFLCYFSLFLSIFTRCVLSLCVCPVLSVQTYVTNFDIFCSHFCFHKLMSPKVFFCCCCSLVWVFATCCHDVHILCALDWHESCTP